MRGHYSSWDNLGVKTAALSELLRKLPSVDDVMRAPAVCSLTESYGHDSVVDAARVVLSGADIPLSGGLVTSFALLLHEFATNARNQQDSYD